MNILIVGLGSIAKKHITALNKISSDFHIYALRSSKSANIIDGITNLYSYNEAEEINFNFAIISNPTASHRSTIEELIKFNIPLFIEKPIYHTLDIESLVLELKQKEIFTYVACNLRYYNCIKYIKNYINNNLPIVNEVNVYCGSYLPEWREGVDYKKVYSAIPELGGGVHIDLIHEFDYIYWFFGNPKSTRRTLKNNSNLDIEAIDYANYLLDYNHFCVGITLNYFRKDYKRTLEIVFDNETWLVDIAKNTITCNSKIIFESEQSFADTYYSQMKAFIENMDKKILTNPAYEALEVLKICLNNESK